jgi:hypothetical protein
VSGAATPSSHDKTCVGVQVDSVGERQRDGLGRRVSRTARSSDMVCRTGTRQFVFCLGEQVLWPHVAHASREVVQVKVDRRRKRNWATCECVKDIRAGAQVLAHID